MTRDPTSPEETPGFATLRREVEGALSTLEATSRLRTLVPGHTKKTSLSPSLPFSVVNRDAAKHDSHSRPGQFTTEKGREGEREGAFKGPIDLTHNDYLGLRGDAAFQDRVHESVRGLPIGAGGSRLLGGEHAVFRQLEIEHAAWKGAPDSLFFASGYAANEAVAVALGKVPGAAFFSDQLNHASLIDGIRLAGLDRSRRTVFAHNDLDDLEARLAASSAPLNCIFTETLFSMDGDAADLPRLGRLARAYKGVLVLDEAHAAFCVGDGGRGLAATTGLPPEQLITIDTCGKAFGVAGALVAAPPWFRAWLVNVARTFIYTTAPSPWLAEALRVALALSPVLAGRRERLAQIGATVRAALQALDYDTGASTSHPVLCGDDRTALAMSDALATHGVLVRAIRPPTVPEGTSRLRLSLNAGLSDDDMERVTLAFTAIRHGLRHA